MKVKSEEMHVYNVHEIAVTIAKYLKKILYLSNLILPLA